MSEFLRVVFWLGVFFASLCGLLGVAVIVALIVRGIRSEGYSDTDDRLWDMDDHQGLESKGAEDEDTETEGQDAVDCGGE